MKAETISHTLKSLADPAIAEHSARFFKTGKGEYGEGDKFLGIRVPVLRAQAKKFEATPLAQVRKLLTSPFHEARLCALLLLLRQYAKGQDDEKDHIYRLYLDNTDYINNWDLVDSSAYHIVGSHLEHRDRQVLYQLAASPSLWERRIAIIATLHFIRNGQFEDTLKLAEQLLNDREDLIHKAVGWMLREIGKRDEAIEEAFLQRHYRQMPRTMLRYAIEKFPEPKRQYYLR